MEIGATTSGKISIAIVTLEESKSIIVDQDHAAKILQLLTNAIRTAKGFPQ